MDLELLKKKMDESRYIYDDTLATVLYVALKLGRPLLIEGAAGVGKGSRSRIVSSCGDPFCKSTDSRNASQKLSAQMISKNIKNPVFRM